MNTCLSTNDTLNVFDVRNYRGADWDIKYLLITKSLYRQSMAIRSQQKLQTRRKYNIKRMKKEVAGGLSNRISLHKYEIARQKNLRGSELRIRKVPLLKRKTESHQFGVDH